MVRWIYNGRIEVLPGIGMFDGKEIATRLLQVRLRVKVLSLRPMLSKVG